LLDNAGVGTNPGTDEGAAPSPRVLPAVRKVALRDARAVSTGI
jgi:hypothetical protein